ncbi:carboxylesterase [Trichocoleus sp. FACHB-262]|uniref:alpha/beta hydrolase n=1 Tax=Trichocoleus sp. FACHB-262 TaxID=2692869 RepID=UPI00168691F2|nr:alpha/beta fold hydrolase [Trichocoleus sp. FACHB-262]MBD2123205.1 alpha/beta fold hydrolase [Trichocoleus sp. FACHB-262]
MPNYSATIAAIAKQAKAREDALPLRHEACRSKFWFHPQPTQRVCLFFHGFTAAPYQFQPIAEAFYKAGYNVLVPLMPGHGVTGNWGPDNPPPLPSDPAIYKQFALQWLQQAQALGKQVIVGGLSGGGTLANWLAFERSQQIYRTLLFAPYLSSSSKVIDLFVQKASSYFQWESKPGSVPVGYSGFLLPNLRVFLNIGQEVLTRSKSLDPVAPMLIISSESDRAVGNNDHRAMFRAVLPRQPKTWYHRFDRVLDIPHTMMTKQEGNEYQNLLITMAKAYTESSLGWKDVEEIGYRMTQGKTFNAVVAELNWQKRVSADMPAMMTMVDKREIVLARNKADVGAD